jgi:hypothetical protein
MAEPLFEKCFAGQAEANREQQIARRFHKFDQANPRFWNLFQRFAFEVINAGRDHYSADAIFHRIRWHVNIELNSTEPVKVNNDYAAHYARKFHDNYPQHSAFFELRKQTSKDRPARALDPTVHIRASE